MYIDVELEIQHASNVHMTEFQNRKKNMIYIYKLHVSTNIHHDDIQIHA